LNLRLGRFLQRWRGLESIWHTHPKSEANEPKKTALAQAVEDVLVVDTLGGRVHVRWDPTAQATPHGQIVFFAEFLATAGAVDRWVQDCPLHDSSPNASRPRDVLGTLMLGILAGAKRYAHMTGVRGAHPALRTGPCPRAARAKCRGLHTHSLLPSTSLLPPA
jgi:hypothetical protein